MYYYTFGFPCYPFPPPQITLLGITVVNVMNRQHSIEGRNGGRISTLTARYEYFDCIPACFSHLRLIQQLAFIGTPVEVSRSYMPLRLPLCNERNEPWCRAAVCCYYEEVLSFRAWGPRQASHNLKRAGGAWALNPHVTSLGQPWHCSLATAG